MCACFASAFFLPRNGRLFSECLRTLVDGSYRHIGLYITYRLNNKQFNTHFILNCSSLVCSFQLLFVLSSAKHAAVCSDAVVYNGAGESQCFHTWGYRWTKACPCPNRVPLAPPCLQYLGYVFLCFLHMLLLPLHYTLCVQVKSCIVIRLLQAGHGVFSFQLDTACCTFGVVFWVLTAGTRCYTLLPLITGAAMMHCFPQLMGLCRIVL